MKTLGDNWEISFPVVSSDTKRKRTDGIFLMKYI